MSTIKVLSKEYSSNISGIRVCLIPKVPKNGCLYCLGLQMDLQMDLQNIGVTMAIVGYIFSVMVCSDGVLDD